MLILCTYGKCYKGIHLSLILEIKEMMFKNALMKIFFNEIEYKASSKSDNLTNY